MTILITSYINPDLDGSACAYAYAEFLKKHGKDTICAISGDTDQETKFVMDRFGISRFESAEDILPECDSVILVDVSHLQDIYQKINPSSVIEIIDHRKVHQAEKFPNAKKQIELVGAAATLIAEKFHETKMDMTKQSAAMLYSAIVSNTINFKANVTTPRDIQMAAWLKNLAGIGDKYIQEMFQKKSAFSKPISQVLSIDTTSIELNNQRIAISQLEIIEADGFVKKHFQEILKALQKIRDDEKSDASLLTVVDIEKGSNLFITVDPSLQSLLTKILSVKWNNSLAKRDGILLRKEIFGLMKKHYDSSKQP